MNSTFKDYCNLRNTNFKKYYNIMYEEINELLIPINNSNIDYKILFTFLFGVILLILLIQLVYIYNKVNVDF